DFMAPAAARAEGSGGADVGASGRHCSGEPALAVETGAGPVLIGRPGPPPEWAGAAALLSARLTGFLLPLRFGSARRESMSLWKRVAGTDDASAHLERLHAFPAPASRGAARVARRVSGAGVRPAFLRAEAFSSLPCRGQ